MYNSQMYLIFNNKYKERYANFHTDNKTLTRNQ